VLEKDEKYQHEKQRSITKNNGGEEYPTDNKMEG